LLDSLNDFSLKAFLQSLFSSEANVIVLERTSKHAINCFIFYLSVFDDDIGEGDSVGIKNVPSKWAA